jgi:hypothetical protein
MCICLNHADKADRRDVINIPAADSRRREDINTEALNSKLTRSRKRAASSLLSSFMLRPSETFDRALSSTARIRLSFCGCRANFCNNWSSCLSSCCSRDRTSCCWRCGGWDPPPSYLTWRPRSENGRNWSGGDQSGRENTEDIDAVRVNSEARWSRTRIT